ncbi:MAG: hypothetical protein MZU97_26405 [Bacillus subtilis]|nr:hypothetical protein [Bacillus subtilis]
MDGVLTPLVVNMFYNCDPLDGKTEYVWSQAKPCPSTAGRLISVASPSATSHATAFDVAAGYFYGLPGTADRRRSTIAQRDVLQYATERDAGVSGDDVSRSTPMEGAGLRFHQRQASQVDRPCPHATRLN